MYLYTGTYKGLHQHLPLWLNLENCIELCNRKGSPYYIHLCNYVTDCVMGFSLFTQEFPINQHHRK